MMHLLNHLNKLMIIFLINFIFSNVANATIYRFLFTNSSTEYIELGGNGAANPPSGTFALLDFDTSIHQFRLYDGPNDYLGTSVQGQGVGLGINGIAFNFGNTIPILGAVSYPSTGSSVFYDVGSMSGLTSIPTPAAINADFDVAYKALDNGNEVIGDANKLIAGESETFEISGFTAATLNNLNGATISSGLLNLQASSIAIRVQSSTGNGVSWFTATSVSAVPELNISAMLLFGLVFLGIYKWKFLNICNLFRLKI